MWSPLLPNWRGFEQISIASNRFQSCPTPLPIGSKQFTIHSKHNQIRPNCAQFCCNPLQIGMIPLQICYKYTKRPRPVAPQNLVFYLVKPGLTRFLPGLDLFLSGLRHTSFLTWFSTRFYLLFYQVWRPSFYTWFNLVKIR